MAYRKGDVVRLRPDARRAFPKSPLHGIVTQDQDAPDTVMVRLAGYRKACPWSVSLIEPEPAGVRRGRRLRVP